MAIELIDWKDLRQFMAYAIFVKAGIKKIKDNN
jgi:hypothetical protein